MVQSEVMLRMKDTINKSQKVYLLVQFLPRIVNKLFTGHSPHMPQPIPHSYSFFFSFSVPCPQV